MSTLHPSALLSFPSPRLLGATGGSEQGSNEGKGAAVAGMAAQLQPSFCDWIACYQSSRRCLLSHYPWRELVFIKKLHVKHTHAHTLRDQLFSLLNVVILCHLMGTGSSVPRVPLDNWLLPHLLTSPPLTFLHFTLKVLHFFCTPEPPSTPCSPLCLLTFTTCLSLCSCYIFIFCQT